MGRGRRVSAVLPCTACTRPAGDGYLCAGCCDRLADRLARVGDLEHELTVTYARLDVLTVSAGRGGEQGLPFAEQATRAAAELTMTVLHWAQQVALARVSVWQLPGTLNALAHWLATRLDWLRDLPAAGQAYSDIDRAVSRARVVIDRPQNRTSFYVGACPEIRESRYCLGEVFAYVPVRIDIEPALMRCRTVECRRHTEPWGTESWFDAGKRMLRLKEQLSRQSATQLHTLAF